MKKLILMLSAFSLLNLGCEAQKSQERNISNFKKIELSGSVNVFFTQSDTLKLSVLAAADEIDRVKTEVVNDALLISNKGRFFSPINVYVSNKYLNELLVSGATDFKTLNVIKSDSLLIDISGSSNVNINIETNGIKMTQNGASDITLKGKSNNLVAEVSGSANLKAYKLEVANANVLTTGASSAKVNVSNKIKANASGASEIKIKGDVKEIYAEASSAASIKRVETTDQVKNAHDTTTFNWGSRRVIVIGDDNDDEKSEVKRSFNHSGFKHWRGTYLGINSFLNPTGGTNLSKTASYMDLKYPKSYNTQVNFIERQFKISKNYFKIVTGLGLDYHRYEFAKKTTLQANSIFTSGAIDTSNTYSYKSNRLRAVYLQVPLLLEFNTSNNAAKAFHLAFGVVGEYLLGASTTQRLEQNGYKIYKRRSDDYNLSPFVAKAHVNFGYNRWTFFGEYNLTPLFERGKGAELYPFNIGLRVIPFS